MNVRKFVAPTSTEALRLVREAIGEDAVVLHNITRNDGQIEIVAVSERDFAAIEASNAEPKAPNRPAPARTPALAPATRAKVPTANPYANGAPDLFSSKFGVSQDPVVEQPAAAREDSSRAVARVQPARTAAPVPPRATEVQRATMADTNPWLVDHARRIAEQAAEAAHNAPVTMTPAAATAKGLGAPSHGAGNAVQPDWARDATQMAAHRAASNLGLPPSSVQTSRENLGAAAAADRTAADRTATAERAAPADRAAAAATALGEAVQSRVERIVSETVMTELSSMRGMMEEQFASLAWTDRMRRNPVQGGLTKRLFAAGFSAQLVQMMAEQLPDVPDLEAGVEWAQSVLERNLPVLENEDELMQRGGVFALMGPTGVGKTTTTAKLAARCVMRFGASKVALLTTDCYRIGAHEQLRIFGKILGVQVHAVKDAADLQLSLSELRNKHIVLIDTIGMSQRDRSVSDQIAMLCGADRPVQRLLVLNSTSHGDTINEVVQTYRSAPDQAGLTGCILTKIDEATNLGSVLDAVIRYRMPVHYVSTGQKVPENLYVATKRFLIKSAFCIPREASPFVPADENVPALLSAMSTRAGADYQEVRFG